MLAVAYESTGQPLPQVSEEGHSRSSPVLCDTPSLLMVVPLLVIEILAKQHRGSFLLDTL